MWPFGGILEVSSFPYYIRSVAALLDNDVKGSTVKSFPPVGFSFLKVMISNFSFFKLTPINCSRKYYGVVFCCLLHGCSIVASLTISTPFNTCNNSYFSLPNYSLYTVMLGAITAYLIDYLLFMTHEEINCEENRTFLSSFQV